MTISIKNNVLRSSYVDEDFVNKLKYSLDDLQNDYVSSELNEEYGDFTTTKLNVETELNETKQEKYEEEAKLELAKQENAEDIAEIENMRAQQEKEEAELKALQEKQLKLEADIKAKEERQAKKEAELKAQKEAYEKKQAEIKKQQEEAEKKEAELKAKQEANAKKEAELKAAQATKAKQEAENKERAASDIGTTVIEKGIKYKIIYIDEDSVASDIAKQLKAEGIISDSADFLNYVVKVGRSTSLKTGKRKVPLNETYNVILEYI